MTEGKEDSNTDKTKDLATTTNPPSSAVVADEETSVTTTTTTTNNDSSSSPSVVVVAEDESSITSSGASQQQNNDDSDNDATMADEENNEDNDGIIDRSNEPNAEEKSKELKEKGNHAISVGQYTNAIKYYSEALEYTPTNAVLLSNRAFAFIKVENYGLALNDADKAVEYDNTYAKGYYRRASANYALNHLKVARKDFRKVCALKPKDRDARAKLQVIEKAIKEEAFAKAIQAEQTAPLSATYNPSTIDIPSSYDGPHPIPTSPDAGGQVDDSNDMDMEISIFQAGKLPRDFVMASMQRFKDQKLIHKRYVARMLLSCRNYFAEQSTLMEITIPDVPPQHLNDDNNDNNQQEQSSSPIQPPRITICGDTHGQYYDVLNIFEKNGYPHSTNPYLFNGDFVDRGSFSFEVICTFLLFKLYDPSSIYLTRGNHETKNMNRIYGFEGEIKAKYDDKIFMLFLEVFDWLPLAAVIEKQVFITHGGLPVDPTITLDDIRKLKRGCEPPSSGLMSDLLWSDPQPHPGKSPSKRGVGFSFGPDITEAFLQRNNLHLLVRSHEVKDDGYLIEHGGKTITVFSAPNYCDTMGNKGAYIHFYKPQQSSESSNNNNDNDSNEKSHSTSIMQPIFTQYDSVPHPDVRPMAYAAGMGGLFA